MSVSEVQHLKQSVQKAIKQVLIDSKYQDEDITFGQAVVTHYFLEQMQKGNVPQSLVQQYQQHQASIDHQPPLQPMTEYQHLNNLNRSGSVQQAHQASHILDSPGTKAQQVVQFDLIKQDLPEFKPQHGRKGKFQFAEEATTVKEVFQWDDGYHESFRKLKMKELQRSPTKWQTENRDIFRKFVDQEAAQKLSAKKTQEDIMRETLAANAQHSQGHACKCGAVQARAAEEAEKAAAAGTAIQGSQPGQPGVLVPHSEEAVSQAQLQAAAVTTDKEHNRKVRINKDAIKKRAQSAKHKVKVDPTRDNYKGPTRWLPDSAFTTYFGKPVFHPYGHANTKPTFGGNVYGQYMMTHNVNPESAENTPYYKQVYPNATKYGLNKNNGTRQPELPRQPVGKKPAEVTLRSATEGQENDRLGIMPIDGPGAVKEKYGKHKVAKIEILKPTNNKQIAKTRQFAAPSNASNHSSPEKEHKSPQKKHKKPHAVNHEPTQPAVVANIEERYETLKPSQIPFNEAVEQQPGFSHADFAIDENQDIGDSDYVIQQQQQLQAQQNEVNQERHDNQGVTADQRLYVPLCEIPISAKADQKELDPRNYQFVPACWTQRIRPAGKHTFKSENVFDVIRGY